MTFVDTSGFVAVLVKHEQRHGDATAFWRERIEQPSPIVTSNFVIDETISFLARRLGYAYAARRGRDLYASRFLRILRPCENDEIRALSLMEKFGDQNVNFTDCISFAIMEQHRIREAFTFDRHFEPAGFERLPETILRGHVP